MSRFKDATGKEWDLVLTVGALRVVRERTKVEIGKLISTERGITELLFGDPEIFAHVLWAMLEKQAAAANLSEQEVADALDGPANERAVMAMLEAIADFFPRSAVGRTIRTRLPELLAAMDERLTTETNLAMDAAVKNLTPSAKAIDSPASAASSPAR